MSYFIGKSYFEEDGVQNYLLFQPIQRYFKRVSNDKDYIISRKSKELSDYRISSITTTNYHITPKLSYYGPKTKAKISGSCIKQEKATFYHGKIVKIYIVYEISTYFNISSYPTLENCLFGAVKLNKHAAIDQYKYSAYGVRFDKKGEFSLSNRVGGNCNLWSRYEFIYKDW